MKIGQLISIVVMIFSATIAIAAGLNLILAAIAQWLWSLFCPYMHLPEMGYWQMWGLLTFISIIATMFRSNVNMKSND